jgi:hypothetical protein
MIKICTVYFKGMYTPDYVANLYDGLKRNSTIPFQFICLSDDPNVKADVVLPYNHHSTIVKHWHKLKFFSPLFGGQQPGDEIVIMDIDQVIVGNVDDLIGHPVGDDELVSYGVFWNERLHTNRLKDNNILPLNGGFYKFKSGQFKHIWDDFALNPEYWQLHYYNVGKVHFKYYGEQNYVDWKIFEKKSKLTNTPQEWLGKYTENGKDMINLNKMYAKKFDTDYMLLDEPNEKLKIVHYTGPNRVIHELKDSPLYSKWINR